MRGGYNWNLLENTRAALLDFEIEGPTWIFAIQRPEVYVPLLSTGYVLGRSLPRGVSQSFENFREESIILATCGFINCILITLSHIKTQFNTSFFSLLSKYLFLERYTCGVVICWLEKASFLFFLILFFQLFSCGKDEDGGLDASSPIPLDDGTPVDFAAIEVVQCLIEHHNAIFTDANETVWRWMTLFPLVLHWNHWCGYLSLEVCFLSPATKFFSLLWSRSLY